MKLEFGRKLAFTYASFFRKCKGALHRPFVSQLPSMLASCCIPLSIMLVQHWQHGAERYTSNHIVKLAEASPWRPGAAQHMPTLPDVLSTRQMTMC